MPHGFANPFPRSCTCIFMTHTLVDPLPYYLLEERKCLYVGANSKYQSSAIKIECQMESLNFNPYVILNSTTVLLNPLLCMHGVSRRGDSKILLTT